ncbi:50S ribosomal protein L6 [bacterium]|nr:50S ribosomal protein L6 [bacterium]
MSRIGKMPITLPKGVTVTVTDDLVQVKGPKGELERKIVGNLEIRKEEGSLLLVTKDDERQTHAYHGLCRTLVNNMVVGVTEGFTKKLRIVGVGYRGEMKGNTVVLNVGYSKPKEYELPKGISGTVSKEGVIELTGIDKEKLGDIAAQIRRIRKPDSYKGKGIRYVDEEVRIKPGTSVSKG